jgi:hypothetical protein
LCCYQINDVFEMFGRCFGAQKAKQSQCAWPKMLKNAAKDRASSAYRPKYRDNAGLTFTHLGISPPLTRFSSEHLMAKEFRTEADRKATPRPVAPKGVCYTTGKGQRISLERGSHTNNKKNPGKRAHQG